MTDQPDTPRKAHEFAATRDWDGYFRAVAGKPPRETLIMALDRFEREGVPDSGAPPLAIDLGSGEGRDTAELLARGYRVLAIDGHPTAHALLARRELPHRDRLETIEATLEDTPFPACLLVNASFSLPFCDPQRFDGVWAKIVGALTSGGRFAGQLFGDRDDWAALPDRSHQSRHRVAELLEPFELEHFEEEERDGEDASGATKHWHVFHIVARKR